jgi:hypothetical protein
VPVGTTAQTTFTIENSGAGELSGQASGPSLPPFNVQGRGAFDLAPGATVTLTVKFSPSTVGQQSSEDIDITSNAVVSPTSVVIMISGSGGSALPNTPTVTPMPTPTPPQPQTPTPTPTPEPGGTLSLSTHMLSFGTVKLHKSAKRSFTIKNIGKATLHGFVDGSGLAPSLSVTSGAGSFSLLHNKKVTVKVTAAPTQAGKFPGTIAITSGDKKHRKETVSVSGRGH